MVPFIFMDLRILKSSQQMFVGCLPTMRYLFMTLWSFFAVNVKIGIIQKLIIFFLMRIS
jgi:hypothetical protein